MQKLKSKAREMLQQLAVFLAVYTPYMAMADEWDQKLVTLGRNVRLGMFAVGGSIALIRPLGWPRIFSCPRGKSRPGG